MWHKHAFPAFLAFAAIAGCASSPQETERLEAANQTLNICLEGENFKELYDACTAYALKRLPEASQNRASERWREYLADRGPDFQLLAAVVSEDVEAARKAIAAGADVNQEFTNETLHGPAARAPSEKQSILVVAAGQMNLELIETLLEAGANPNQRGPDDSRYDFATVALISRHVQYDESGQNVIRRVSGPEIGLLAIKYGYIPTQNSLEFIERQLNRTHLDREVRAKLTTLYEKLLLVAENRSQKQVAGTDTKAKELCDLHSSIAQDKKNSFPMDIGEGNLRLLDRSQYDVGKDVCEVTLRYETHLDFWARVVMSADNRYQMPLARKFVQSEHAAPLIKKVMREFYQPEFESMDRPEMDVTMEVSFREQKLHTIRFPLFGD